MKKQNKEKIAMWILSIIPLLAILFLFQKLPDKVPSHWNLNGSVTYSNKSTLLFLGALPIFMAFILSIAPKIDPKKESYKKFEGFYFAFAIAIMLLLMGLVAIVISESFYPGKINVSTVVVSGIGILFTFIGNMFPKLKSNYSMGIKTPWTLANEDVWFKTHRLSGFLWFIGGLLILISAFLLSFNQVVLFTVFFCITFLISVIPMVMSYIWFKKLSK